MDIFARSPKEDTLPAELFTRSVFLARLKRFFINFFGASIATCLVFFIVYLVLIAPPDEFEKRSFVQIRKGMTVSEAAEYLYDRSLIRSRMVFKLFMRLPHVDGKMIAGDYFFDEALSSYEIALRFSKGDFNVEPYKVVIPEGKNIREIGEILEASLPGTSATAFVRLASTSEGYLFPDTYFFSPLSTEGEIITRMIENYTSATRDITSRIKNSGRTEANIVTMASMVELEASRYEDRQRIADILWRRLDEGMLLQVDAVFPYLLGKNTYEVTLKDLQTDSPYNTYKYKGLPPGPIGNPGIEAMKAVLNPIPSDYWYYLSDKEGNFYYAKTYKEHLVNREKYLE